LFFIRQLFIRQIFKSSEQQWLEFPFTFHHCSSKMSCTAWWCIKENWTPIHTRTKREWKYWPGVL